jgi:lysosomal acid lipase/cholesteryl ester hydrolase
MGVTMMNISTFLLDATAAIVSPTNTKAPRSALVPINGAPLASDASLVPQKYLEKADTPAGPRDSHSSPVSSTASAVNLHPGIHNPHLKLNLVRSPPSQLLDAPARAALNMPNAATASGQARAVRGGEAKTPEYDIEAEDGLSGGRRGREEHVPLLAPTAVRPGLSRSSSTPLTPNISASIFVHVLAPSPFPANPDVQDQLVHQSNNLYPSINGLPRRCGIMGCIS